MWTVYSRKLWTASPVYCNYTGMHCCDKCECGMRHSNKTALYSMVGFELKGVVDEHYLGVFF